MEWDQNKVEELAKLIEKYGLTEAEVQVGDTCIKLKKEPTPVQMIQGGQGYPLSGLPYRPSVDFRRITEKKAEQDELESVKNATKSETPVKPTGITEVGAAQKYVISPITGIFYRQSQPGNPPYVEVGQKVKKGDVVCLVEAMKMINEIAADRDGVVKEFLVENEQFVEYGAPLVLIEEE